MNKFRTFDGKLFIDLKKGYTVWRRYFNKIPYNKYPISEVISDEDYNTSIRSLINILESDVKIWLNSRTEFSYDHYVEEYYCVGDLKYTLTLSKDYESYFLVLNLRRNFEDNSVEVYKNKSEILDFINQHFLL